eukprot:Skav211014  [mRNA]  locus=scaffold134:107904:114375:- [translate_table: standard]
MVAPTPCLFGCQPLSFALHTTRHALIRNFSVMQGLGRFAQHTESEASPGAPTSGTALMETTTMYQPVPTSEDFDGMTMDEPRCLSTRGTIFNFIVGLVVCANAILMGVEADLGLLGPAGPTWAGLQADLEAVHAVPEMGHGIEAEIKSGITGDQILKEWAS